MTLLRDVIKIPESVGEGDFVVRASERADLANYVVTDQLRDSFAEALATVEHALASGRSQAKFLHGSFGSGKSHFMAVLREILRHNADVRAIPGLDEVTADADRWLPGRTILTLTFHMLDAQSVEQAVLEGYRTQIMALHPDAAPPAVHRSDSLLDDAAKLRVRMGDEAFFAAFADAGRGSGLTGGGLAAYQARAKGWQADSYARAAGAAPGTPERDDLVSALTATFFSGAVHSGEYLDLDTGLAVVTRHAKSLGYDVLVCFLDEMILWLSTKLADHTFVNTEGAKLNKLVESADAARPLPIVSFVARQRNLEDFLGPQVGGTEREALAHVMRSVQGRLGIIELADTNLPEIVERRLLKPVDPPARKVIDQAFDAVRSNRLVWDTLLPGAQYGDAGVGSDATVFRRLYPFSPALVATLVALSQALQRERTALRVLTQLLVDRRATLAVNDLIGVAALFEPLVLRGELPDRPVLKQRFQAARDTYRQKLRALLLARNGITEEQAAGHTQFEQDDRLVRTLLLGALVPEVPALQNLTAARLHALNFGTITAPVPGYESHIVVDRLTRLAADAGEVRYTEGPDPVFSLTLSSVDYDKLLDLVPHNETATGVLQQLVRELVCDELGLTNAAGTFGDLPYAREWRGRRHPMTVRFGNIRDRDSMPDATLYATGDSWRIVVDYPFDAAGHTRRSDLARIEQLDRGSRTVFWLPLFLSDDMMSRVSQLAKISYLLGGDRLSTLAADWSPADRQQGRVYLQQRQQQLRSALLDALKQAYGAAKPQVSDVEIDEIGVLHTLAEGLRPGDPRGGTLSDAFANLTGDLLRWSYPGKPALPDDEKAVSRAELAKVLRWAKAAAADPTHGAAVDTADRAAVKRICHPLQLGQLSDHRYVLTGITCWWSGHLTQEAAKRGYKDQFPVHLLRELIDLPQPHGFDRDLQNLILAVVALEQQLAWFEHGGKIELGAVQQVADHMELRHPVMPGPDEWKRAVGRVKLLFGRSLPDFLTPATVAELASAVRTDAGALAVPAETLHAALTRHAHLLGLDPDARSGRMATARRMARLLGQLAAERDNVVLIRMVAEAEVGDIGDLTAGVAAKQAQAVTSAITATQWPLLEAVEPMAQQNEMAAVILDELRAVAAAEQHVHDLAPALAKAVAAATALLVRPTPQPVDHVVDVTKPAELSEVADRIGAELADGHTVRVSWRRLP